MPDESDAELNKFVAVDFDDDAAAEDVIASSTERVVRGQPTLPGFYIDLARRASGERPPTASTNFTYSIRAGFIDKRRPYNHIVMQLEDGTEERTLMGYMSALVQAWEPDRLGAVTLQAKKAQGNKPPEVAIGRLTYIRSGTTLNISALSNDIDVAAADGGHYIRVPGTPDQPSLDHIATVRRALGYSG